MNPESSQKRIAFGYDRFDGQIVINEGQAAVVKLIYGWYTEGMSLREIKKTLEGMFIPSPQKNLPGVNRRFPISFQTSII